ncbi:MAG: tetratricopeptide repeat protein [Rikenellaceae bacterium]|nr:tetratricopeptide repeat protein [Rikenellaceae bacterium]
MTKNVLYNKYIGIVFLAVLLFVCSTTESKAQYLRERGLVRQGNSSFSKRNYRTSLNRYNEALEHDSTSYEALYNRANAHHQVRRTNPQDSTLKAETTFSYYEQIAADTLLSDAQRAEVLRNLGESLFSEERYEAALNAFRESLRLNPEDRETKYDYVLTKRIVDQKRQQQQNQEQQNQNNNQNQDNQQEGQNNQNQNQNQEQEQNSENNQDKKPQDENRDDENTSKQEPKDNPEDKEEQSGNEPRELNSDKERMLDAIQAEEDKTQDKLKDKKRGVVIPGKKNW